jgi:hypothetical protein
MQIISTFECIASFYLHRDMVNAELLAEHLVNLSEWLVAQAADQVDRNCVLTVRECPDVQAVDRVNAADLKQGLRHSIVSNLKWSRLHEHIDAVHKCNPSGIKHDDTEHVSANGI